MELGKPTGTKERNSEEWNKGFSGDAVMNLKKDNGRDQRRFSKSSMIPKPKFYGNNSRGSLKTQRESLTRAKYSSPSYASPREYPLNQTSLEDSQRNLNEYFSKIEKHIQNIVSQRESSTLENAKANLMSPTKNSARKMTSEPTVFKKETEERNILSEFENDVRQISSIWLKTSVDLTNTLRSLKNNPSFDSAQFEAEKVKIQMAIKQAKSLTIMKTRTVIAEAKKLMNHREMIRTELEKFLSSENIKWGNPNLGSGSLKDGFSQNSLNERKLSPRTPRDDPLKQSNKDGMGDSTTDEENQKKLSSGEAVVTKPNAIVPVLSSEKEEKSEELDKSTHTGTSSEIASLQSADEGKISAELAKKNEIIAQLHKKIFELQKTCNEHTTKYNQLQLKLAEFHEKIKWDQVLWKQIGKLKELIKGLQQNNKQLESQKTELEHKITKLDKELQRLIKLNQVLNQKKYLMYPQEKSVQEKSFIEDEEVSPSGSRTQRKDSDPDSGYDTPERILAEKQNLINQLNTILDLMRDQENVAQRQIAAFQSKIEELEKNTTTY